MLLCDIGNTTYHFFDGENEFKIGVKEVSKLPKNKTIYYISVNESATKELSKNNKIVNLADFVKFKTNYKGLGVDRIFACLRVSDGVIVDAGSAITIDVMQESTHLGGTILLGLNSHKRNFNAISEKLNFDLNRDINLEALPQNTIDALSYATLKSTILVIKEIAKEKKLIFTGGDGEFLSKFFKNSIYERDLIFKSMIKVIKENSL